MQMSTATVPVVLFLLHMLASEGQTASNDPFINSTFASCDPPPRCSSKTTPLYIQGFVAAQNEIYTAETIIPAAYLAIDDINANCSILPGYLLQIEFVNTKCDPSEATWQVINSIVLNDANQKFLFLGGGCSLDTEPLAAMAGRFYQIPFLSYGASSPFLSERDLFPTFFRTIPSEAQSNEARFAIMRNNSWKRVATLHQTETIFSKTVEDFHGKFDEMFGKNPMDENVDDKDLTLRSFTDDPEISLRQIKEKDVRIIMGFFYEDMARVTMCKAFYMNLTTTNHVWMLPAWYSADWYNTTKYKKEIVNCTVEQMVEAVKYVFYLDSYNFGPNKTVLTDTGRPTAEEFESKFECYLKEFLKNPIFSEFHDSDSSIPHAYRTFTYDGIWALGLALDGAEKVAGVNLADFAYFNEGNVSETVIEYMNFTNFVGVSGDVTFDETGSRKGLNGIYQLMKDKEDGMLKLELIAIHDPHSNFDPDTNGDCAHFLQCFPESPPQWRDGIIPRDRRRPKHIYLNEGLVGFFDFLITVSIIVAIALLVFNLVTLRKPLIRDSAPHINTIIIIGCIVMLVTCILLGIDSSNPDTDAFISNETDVEDIPEDILEYRNSRYALICMFRLWCLTLGFTLSFGALFAKTWQVYHIYANPKLKYEPFKLWNFLIIMVVLLTIDVLYLSFWTGYAPFSREMPMDRDDSESDELLIYEKCACRDFSYLIGALYGYKGLLALFGLFLAYESRNVKYIYINDSRFVSITMYIVVILVGIGAPLSLVLADHSIHNVAYFLTVTTIIGACMSCLLILTIPKFVYMAKGKDTMVRVKSEDEINVPDGLQLSRRKSSTVVFLDQNDAKASPDSDDQPKEQVAEKKIKSIQKSRIGSDRDSGVLVTGDENDTFSSSASTTLGGASGDNQRPVVCTNPLTDSTPSASESDTIEKET